MQLWNAGYNARLTAECWAGKATINLQLTLRDITPPPPRAFQVRHQPQRPGPSRLRRRERSAEACSAAANTADAPEADASEATDNSESHTAAVNTADATEDATLKKPTGGLTDDTSKKKSKLKHSRSPLVNCLLTPLIKNLSRSLFHLAD